MQSLLLAGSTPTPVVAQRDDDGLTLRQGGNVVYLPASELQKLADIARTATSPSKARLMRCPVGQRSNDS